MIDNQLLFNAFFYAVLAINALLGVLSLLLIKNRLRMIFLFLFFITISMAEFLLFSGIAVFITGMVFMLFYILLLAFSYNEDVFRDLSYNIEISQARFSIRIITLVTGLAVCGLIAYWFYGFTAENIQGIADMRNFNFTTFDQLLSQIFDNYLLVVLLVIIGLFLSIVWFAFMASTKNKREGKKR